MILRNLLLFLKLQAYKNISDYGGFSGTASSVTRFTRELSPQFRRSAKTSSIVRVTNSKLQVCSPSLRFSGTDVPHTFFLSARSILTCQTMRPVSKQTRRAAVKAMFRRFSEKAIKVIYYSFCFTIRTSLFRN